jgi:hypothetical protein
MEVVTALRRLGYVDKPSVGDHLHCFKLLDHPEGRVTIRTGVDGKHCGKSDVTRIKRDTKLGEGDLWDRAMAKQLDQAEYDDYLKSLPKRDLVLPFWRNKF